MPLCVLTTIYGNSLIDRDGFSNGDIFNDISHKDKKGKIPLQIALDYMDRNGWSVTHMAVGSNMQVVYLFSK